MKQSKNINILVNFFTVLVIIILVNIISSFRFLRIDLTADKRFTLSDQTVELLKNVDDVVYIKIYLDGEMPIGFQRMQKAVKELLDEFRVYAGSNIQYDFVNPSDNESEQQRDRIYQDIYQRGLDPFNAEEQDQEGGISEKILFPGAFINYQDREIPLNLFKDNPAFSTEVDLNNSIQNLEYEFAKSIEQLTKKEYQKVAFIEGHNELDQYDVDDITRSLSQYYEIHRVTIDGVDTLLKDYSVVIVAQPFDPWPEEDKYALDQYIMNGGKVLWFIDPLNINLDTLATGASTFVFIRNTNLDDQLFRYGVRINPTIIQDLQCAVIPINTSPAGIQPKFVPAPWVYKPLLVPPSNHPITKDLNMIKAEYASVIDTLKSSTTKKQILLYSSQRSRTINAPALVSLSEVANDINEAAFKQAYLPVAVMLDGTFESCFKNRMISEFRDQGAPDYKEMSSPTKMIVVSDGDIIRNEIYQRAGRVVVNPLGFDRYTKQTYGNKEFIMNAVHYLADEGGLLELRSREFTLRLLDKNKIKNERTKWQMINILLPLILVVMYGVGSNLLRKRKYS